MKICTHKVLCSSVFLMLVAFSNALVVAQAADVLVTDPNEEVVSGQQSQVLHPDTDVKRPPPPHAPNEITLDPTLVGEIKNNHALLEHQTPWLIKQMGYLDRRTKKNIESTLRDAHSIMSHLRDVLKSGQLGTRQARNIAQELNYQGDNLDVSLNEWKKDLGVMGEDTLAADSKQKKALQEQKQLVRALSNISRMLHDTGKALVLKAD